MKSKLNVVCKVLAFSLLALPIARAASVAENVETAETAIAEIDKLDVPGIPAGQKSLLDRSKKLIEDLVRDWRLDQDRVYAFVRALSTNISALDCAGDSICNDFKKDTFRVIDQLLVSTYSDSVGQNGNLSNQLKVRLPLLLADSLRLQGSDAQFRDSFFLELNILAQRWLKSRRFRAGIGASLNYLPSIDFNGRERVDFSPFLPSNTGGLDTLLYNADFRNESYPTLSLSAETKWVILDAAFPVFDTTNNLVTPVRAQTIADGPDEILSRTTITSKMSIDFDISARFSFHNFWHETSKLFRREDDLNERRDVLQEGLARGNQVDFGIGLGATGFQLENSVSTDVRTRNDGVTTFNGLPTGSTISSSNVSSFTSLYLFGFYDVKLTDTVSVGTQIRYYNDTTSEGTEVVVDDLTFGIYAIWYPTFPWSK